MPRFFFAFLVKKSLIICYCITSGIIISATRDWSNFTLIIVIFGTITFTSLTTSDAISSTTCWTTSDAVSSSSTSTITSLTTSDAISCTTSYSSDSTFTCTSLSSSGAPCDEFITGVLIVVSDITEYNEIGSEWLNFYNFPISRPPWEKRCIKFSSFCRQ